jgi:hypothetical protein
VQIINGTEKESDSNLNEDKSFISFGEENSVDDKDTPPFEGLVDSNAKHRVRHSAPNKLLTHKFNTQDRTEEKNQIEMPIEP